MRFSELIDDTLEKGPQVVTHRGIDTAVVNSIDEWHKLRDENPLTGRMYFWVKVRDSKFHYPNVARSNRASLRCSIDPLPDRHEPGVRIARAQGLRCGSRLVRKSWIARRLLLGGNVRRNQGQSVRSMTSTPGYENQGKRRQRRQDLQRGGFDDGRQKYPAFDALHGNFQERIIRL